MSRGKLIVVYGNMYSNKTGTLIQKIETLRNYGKKKIFVAKPKTDTRSKEGYIENSEGKQMEAFEIPSKKNTGYLQNTSFGRTASGFKI